ncbi:MAG: SDR family oxidoreductase [candidate division WOR-3 bacterium]
MGQQRPAALRSYRGKAVYITGGSSGIGLEAARQFASLGADVAIFARGQARLETALGVLEQVRIDPGQRFRARALDVTNAAAVRSTMAELVQELGAPTVLINSAGSVTAGHFLETSSEQRDAVMATNFYGTWNTVAALVPYMLARGGNIVNISSIAGLVGVFGYTAYAASKFAVTGFSEALRSELKGQGIVVSCLCPPDTDTPQLAEDNRIKPPETRAISGTARVMRPAEVVRAMIRGMERGRAIITPGFGRIVFSAKRLVPGLVEASMDRDIRRVQSRRHERKNA